MADAVSVGGLPAGMDLYAGYDDGRYDDAAAIAAAEGGKTVIRITVFPSDNEGDCLDVESGDATPAQAPGWVSARRQAGHGGPLVYCSESIWAQVQQAFASAGVAQPGYWIAGYPGSVGDALYPGSVGHQWIDHGSWDESIMADYLPGIDPAPTPPPTPVPPTPTQIEESDMITVTESAVDGNRHVFVYDETAKTVTHWYQSMVGKPSYAWQHEQLPGMA